MLSAASAMRPGIRPALSDLPWILGLFVFFGWAAARLGTDGTPDFKIYHFYNGFAVLHDRSRLDIFAAQLQTGFFPGLDAVYYALFRVLNRTPTLLNLVLSLPYGIAATVIYLMARPFIPAPVLPRNAIAALTAVAGLTGAAALPTLATTMSDVVPAVPLLIALGLWAHLEAEGAMTVRRAAVIGALGGVSVGLKLTLTPVFIGLFLVVLFARFPRSLLRPWQALALGSAGLLAFAVLDVPWLWRNWTQYGNPIFPLMNHVFRSDLVDPGAWTDLRFMPKSNLMALIYPAFWAFDLSQDAIELNMRDPRLLFGCGAAITILAAHLRRRWRGDASGPLSAEERVGLGLAVLFLLSYLLWLKVWSIYRYLAVQEMLACVLLLIAFTTVGARPRRIGRRIAAHVVLVVAIMASTAYPWWGRAQPGPAAMSVNLPAIEADAMVVFLDAYSYSYLVPLMPRTVRAIGANSNLVRPGSNGTLQPRIEAAIRDHRGPVWGFEFPRAFPGTADATLAHHRLQRTEDCVPLDSSIEDQREVRICRLRRVP